MFSSYSIFWSLHHVIHGFHVVFSVSLLSSGNILKAMSLMYPTFSTPNIPFPSFPLTLNINLSEMRISYSGYSLQSSFEIGLLNMSCCRAFGECHNMLYGWLKSTSHTKMVGWSPYGINCDCTFYSQTVYIIQTCESLLTSQEFIIIK